MGHCTPRIDGGLRGAFIPANLSTLWLQEKKGHRPTKINNNKTKQKIPNRLPPHPTQPNMLKITQMRQFSYNKVYSIFKLFKTWEMKAQCIYIKITATCILVTGT